MADLTRSNDIKPVQYIVPTRRIEPKRKRLNIRDRSPQQQNKKQHQPEKKKNHIDVYV